MGWRRGGSKVQGSGAAKALGTVNRCCRGKCQRRRTQKERELESRWKVHAFTTLRRPQAGHLPMTGACPIFVGGRRRSDEMKQASSDDDAIVTSPLRRTDLRHSSRWAVIKRGAPSCTSYAFAAGHDTRLAHHPCDGPTRHEVSRSPSKRASSSPRDRCEAKTPVSIAVSR